MSDPAPVSDAEFAALMFALGPFDAARRVVVAVSGGADSMALAVLLARWGLPLAAVVDHGVRPESAAEAAATARRLQALGLPVEVARADLRPGPALAERARTARYALLFDICRAAGRPDLLVAHHAADQAETVRIRERAGSGPAGLAGMAPIDCRAEARLLRPLLGVDPARLRATLRQAGIGWVEDPGNADPSSLRARLRATLTPADRAGLLARAAVAADCRGAAELAAAAELARVRLAPEGFAVVPGPIGGAALSALVWTLSGARHPPSPGAMEAGLASRTMHGVVLRPAGRLGPGVLIAREPAAIAPPVAARAGLVWDGRFRLSGDVPPGLTLGALGDAAALRRRSRLPAIVLAGLPALRRDGLLWAVPHLDFPDAPACRSVRLTFWPARPAGAMSFGDRPVNPSESRGV